MERFLLVSASVLVRRWRSNEKLPMRELSKKFQEEADFLAMLEGAAAAPTLRAHAEVGGFAVIVMDLLGQSVWDLFTGCKGQFSSMTVLLLADQMITRLEEVHSVGIVHRDVKPDNFLMGRGSKAGVVHIADLGLAAFYRDPSGKHVSFTRGRKLTGSARFASVHAHDSTQSRRDDLESLGYNLVYLLLGNLPWQTLEIPGQNDHHEEIRQMKKHAQMKALCKGCPDELVDFLRYCRKLDFEATPDYSYLRQLVRDAMGPLNLQESSSNEFPGSASTTTGGTGSYPSSADDRPSDRPSDRSLRERSADRRPPHGGWDC